MRFILLFVTTLLLTSAALAEEPAEADRADSGAVLADLEVRMDALQARMDRELTARLDRKLRPDLDRRLRRTL